MYRRTDHMPMKVQNLKFVKTASPCTMHVEIYIITLVVFKKKIYHLKCYATYSAERQLRFSLFAACFILASEPEDRSLNKSKEEFSFSDGAESCYC
jgi:hypothetical protein